MSKTENKPGSRPGPDPHQVTAHQQWVDLLTSELQRAFNRQHEPAHKRANKAIQKAVDFENFRLQVHANELSQLHQQSASTEQILKTERAQTAWYRFAKRYQLDREVRDWEIREDCFRKAFLVMTETRIPAQTPNLHKDHGTEPCDQCGGTGYAGPTPDESMLCTHCKGSGTEPAEMSVQEGGAKQ